MGKYLNTMISAATMYQSAVGKTKKTGTKVEGKVADPDAVTHEKTTTVDTSGSDAMTGPRPDSGAGEGVDPASGAEIQGGVGGGGGGYKPYKPHSDSDSPIDKQSPYKMSGMSWKEGQTPVKNLNGVNSTPAKTKASPNKELLTIGILAAMAVGAIMDASSAKKQRKAEAQKFNVNARNEANQMNRKHELLAMDKKSKSLENFADTAKAQSQIYAQGASSKKFS